MSGSQCTHKPDEHADGVGDQEAVIQNPKQRLIVVLICRDDTDENKLFFPSTPDLSPRVRTWQRQNAPQVTACDQITPARPNSNKQGHKDATYGRGKTEKCFKKLVMLILKQ